MSVTHDEIWNVLWKEKKQNWVEFGYTISNVLISSSNKSNFLKAKIGSNGLKIFFKRTFKISYVTET